VVLKCPVRITWFRRVADKWCYFHNHKNKNIKWSQIKAVCTFSSSPIRSRQERQNATYDGTSGAGRLPVGVGLGPILDGTVGAGRDGPPGAGLCGIVGFGTGPDLDPATDLGDGGLSHEHTDIIIAIPFCWRTYSNQHSLSDIVPEHMLSKRSAVPYCKSKITFLPLFISKKNAVSYKQWMEDDNYSEMNQFRTSFDHSGTYQYTTSWQSTVYQIEAIYFTQLVATKDNSSLSQYFFL